jgi:hypothetical protein
MALRGSSRRDDRFDFLRGLALLVIFIDHVPKNFFEPFTLHSVAFCDAAEVFFFISGYVAAMVYGRFMLKNGFVAATRKVWRRAGVVYGAQMFLLVAVLALVWTVIHVTGDQTFRYIFRIQWAFDAPLAYVLPSLTMHYQPGYLDILPAYVVLLAVFPAVLWAMSRNVWLVLVPSFLLWLTVQVFGLSFWTTSGERWFFNPFAWQFLFVIGGVFGHPSMKGKFAFITSPWLLWASVAVVVPTAIIQIGDTLYTYGWMTTTLRPETMMLDKPSLGTLRLVSFFALALLTRRLLPVSGVLSANRWTLPVIRSGRFSLQVFSFGALLSSFTAVSWVLSGSNVMVQTLAAIAGVAAQLALGAWLVKRREAADAKRREEIEPPCREEPLARREESLGLGAPVSEPVAMTVHSEPCPPRP